MAAHGVTIIGEQDIARLDVFLAPELDFCLDRVRQAADEHRQAQADGDRVAVGVKKPDGEILGFVNNRVVRRAHQVGLHLAGDGDHRAPDDFGRKSIDSTHLDPYRLEQLERLKLLEQFQSFKPFQKFQSSNSLLSTAELHD